MITESKGKRIYNFAKYLQEKAMAPHSSTLCLENPMDGGAWWAAVHGVAKPDMTEQLHFHFSLSCIGEEMVTHSVFLLRESQGQRSLVGCHLWGCTELDTTEAT